MKITVKICFKTLWWLFALHLSLIYQSHAQLFNETKNTDNPMLYSIEHRGFVRFHQELSRLTCDNGLCLGLKIIFTSNPEYSSIFGPGWYCPLLESRAFHIDEKTLVAITPWGQEIVFVRHERSPNEYKCFSSNWQVVSKGTGSLKIKRPDGISLVYNLGKLSSLQIDEKDFLIWKENTGKLTAVFQRGKGDRITLSYNYSKGYPDKIHLDGHLFEFDIGEQGINKIMLPEGGQMFFSRVDTAAYKGLKLNYLKGLSRTYYWDPLTRWITEETVGDIRWKYTVTPVFENSMPASTSNKKETATITTEPSTIQVSRINQNGEKESYYYDKKKGISEYLHVDGKVRRQHWFLSPGPLYGKIRKIEEVTPLGVHVIFKPSYNEEGKLIRSRDQGGNTFVYVYNNQQQLMKIYDGRGRILLELDSSGRPVSYFNFANGANVALKYLPDESVILETTSADQQERITLLKTQDEIKKEGIFFDFLNQ